MKTDGSKVSYGLISMVNQWLDGVKVISLVAFGLISSGIGIAP